MIKFFRKIRQQLLTENRFSKYLLYAVGEIMLVVIGILIALQINNWNEDRKEKKLEKVFLQGIISDLSQDTLTLNKVIRTHKIRLAHLLQQDSTIQVNDFLMPLKESLPTVDKMDDIAYFFQSSRAFRPKRSNYKSLISEGKSNLISNRELFNKLQNLYEREYESILFIGQSLWDRTEDMRTDFAFEIKYANFGSPIQIRDQKMLADFDSLFDLMCLYTMITQRAKEMATSLLHELDNELNTNFKK